MYSKRVLGERANRKLPRESKTLRNAKVIEVVFMKDESVSDEIRITEAKNLIAQMIEMSHRRGRPRKVEKENEDAA